MRISDWSSDVCSSDLAHQDRRGEEIFDPMFADERDDEHRDRGGRRRDHPGPPAGEGNDDRDRERGIEADAGVDAGDQRKADRLGDPSERAADATRSEERRGGKECGRTWTYRGSPD